MLNLRLASVLAALAIAVGATVTLVSAGGPPPATTTPAKVGSVSGTVVDKDGKPAGGAQIRGAAAPASAPATTPGAPPARGGRGGARGPTTMADDKGAFTLKDVPVGPTNITATVTAADGTRQRATTGPVDVKEGAETKIATPLKLADAPARGGPGGPGGPPPTPPASMPGN